MASSSISDVARSHDGKVGDQLETAEKPITNVSNVKVVESVADDRYLYSLAVIVIQICIVV